MLIKIARPRLVVPYAPSTPSGYTPSARINWDDYATTQAAIDDLADATVASGIIANIGTYNTGGGGYDSAGFPRATWASSELYKLMGGSPFGLGSQLRMCFPTGNELSTPNAGPETGGPYAMTNWNDAGPSPLSCSGSFRFDFSPPYPSYSIFHLWRRFSTTADRPANGISNGWTTNGDLPTSSADAQKMGHGNRTGGSGYGTGGHRKEILGSGWNMTPSNGSWTDETVTNYGGVVTGSTLVTLRDPIDSTNNHDGWWHDVYIERRLSDNEWVAYGGVRLEYTRAGAAIDNSAALDHGWRMKRFYYTNAPTPSFVSPTGMTFWRTHQNRNTRNHTGTSYEFWGPLEVVNGSTDGPGFVEQFELPGFDLPGWD